MLVVRQQLRGIQSGRVKLVLVPESRCSDWKIGDKIPLWRMTAARAEQRRESERVRDEFGRQEQVVVTSVGRPLSINGVSRHMARQAGFAHVGDLRRHCVDTYTARERRDQFIPVGVELVVDRPVFMASRSGAGRSDYTSSTLKAVDQLEVVTVGASP